MSKFVGLIVFFTLIASANANTFAAAPTAPTNLTAATISVSEIRLYWQDNSNSETGFKIERALSEAGPFTQVGTIGINVQTCRVINLTPNTIYYFRVRAYNASGNSAYTNIASATTLTITFTLVINAINGSVIRLPSGTEVAGGYAYPQGTTVQLTASANSGYYFTSWSGDLSGNTNPTTITINSNKTVNANFLLPSQMPPAVPSNLTAMTLSTSEISLNWQDNSNNETGFKIERKPGYSFIFTQIATVGANVSAYRDSGLETNVTYNYRVRAYNNSGDSDYSNMASAKTSAGNHSPVLAPIGNKTVTEGVALIFTISATDPDNNILTYSASGLPLGAVFDASTATFNWTPAVGKVGTYSGIKFTVSDGSLSAEETITITVNNNTPTSITVGKAVIGVINAPKEKANISFNANANDIITIRAVTISGTLLNYLELYAPDGSKLLEGRTQLDRALSVTGRYTITVRDLNNSGIGTYYLIYGTLNNNSWAQPVTFGQAINGEMAVDDLVKFYQFSANAGDTVTISATPASILPYLELFGPDGATVAIERDQINKALPATGKYTILLRDLNYYGVGGYILKCVKNNAAPYPETIIPSSGSCQADTPTSFTVTFSDPNGYLDIEEVYLLINVSANGANCLYAYYNCYLDELYLRDDANSAWLGGYAPGTPVSIENSYSVLDCEKTEVNKSGSSVTVKWRVSFKPSFSNHDYKVYLSVKDKFKASSGWQPMGTWRVDPRTGPVNVSVFKPEDKGKFLEGATINCLANADSATDTYEYQYLVDGAVKKAYSPENKWDWVTSSQDKGLHTLTIKVRNQYGTTAEDSHRLIIYRRPVEPQ